MTDKKRTADVGFFCVFALCIGFLIWKARFGYQYYDEPFVISTANRFLQGSAPFVDEWNPAQLSAIVLYPILRLYHLINGSSEGLMLNFRYIYLSLHVITSLFFFVALKKDSRSGASAGAILYLLYTPLHIMTLSYNTMAIGCVSLGALLLYVSDRTEARILAGLFLAGAVLCYPLFAAAYVIYTLLVIINAKNERDEKHGENELFGTKTWLSLSIGVLAAVIAFGAFVLSRCSLRDFIANIPNVLDEPDHKFGYLTKTLMFFADFYNRFYPAMAVTDGVLTLIGIIALCDKNRQRRKTVYILVSSGVAAVGSAYIFANNEYLSFLNVIIIFLGVISYILTENRGKKLFSVLFVSGLLLGFFGYLGSNQRILAFAAGVAPAVPAAAVFICRCAGECFGEKKPLGNVSGIALAAVLLFTALTLFVGRNNNCYWEISGSPYILCSEIDTGSAGGQFTTEEVRRDYMSTREETEEIRNAVGENVLYFGFDTWLYTEDVKKCSAFSTWISIKYPMEDAQRILRYWDAHPGLRPDAIYVSKRLHRGGVQVSPEEIVALLNTEGFPVEEKEYGYVMLRQSRDSDGIM